MTHDHARTMGVVSQQQKRALLDRLLASELFSSSPRLSAFLSYICEQDLLGKASEIHEQRIGMAVFGRTEGYDVANDSIVRSQARFLRIRLENYFAAEGSNEELILRVPKGGYQPLFEWRETAGVIAASVKVSSEAGPVQPLSVAGRPSWKRIGSAGGMVFLLVFVGWLIERHYLQTPIHASQTADAQFWNSILDEQRMPIIVPSDSSLVLLEQMEGGRPVSLADYMNRKYLNNVPRAVSENLWRNVAISQYTSLADLKLIARVEQNSEVPGSRAQIRYARDLSLTELKQTNAILIGGVRSNPWVELFRPAMRLAVDFDQQSQRNFVQNRNASHGEQDRYYESGAQGSHIAYGVIAYLGSLDGKGSALLVGGTSKGGTEGAAEFLFSTNFSQFLNGLVHGQSIPHFEILIATENINGESHDSKVVCFHHLD